MMSKEPLEVSKLALRNIIQRGEKIERDEVEFLVKQANKCLIFDEDVIFI